MCRAICLPVWTAAFLGGVLVGPAPAAGQEAASAEEERYDHRGSLGLLLEGSAEYRDRVSSGLAESGLQYPVGVGGTWAVNYDGDELKLIARVGLGGNSLELLFGLGYRGYFGLDRLKTFLDLDAELVAAPRFFIGPRVGFGLMYEVTSNVGVYGAIAGKIGVGQGLRLSAEAAVGVQVRSYLLE